MGQRPQKGRTAKALKPVARQDSAGRVSVYAPHIKADLSKSENLETLESLLDELGRVRPRAPYVRECMLKLGIPYQADPVECLNSILTAIDA